MPVYEYACESCQNRFDVLVRKAVGADEGPPSRGAAGGVSEVACPTCSGQNVRKLISAHASSPRAEAPMGGGGCCPCGDPSGPCNKS